MHELYFVDILLTTYISSAVMLCSDNSVSWPLELDTSDAIVGINPDSRLCLCSVAQRAGLGTISVVCTFPIQQHSVPRTNIWPKYDNSWPGAGSILIGQCLKTTKIPPMNCASKEPALQHKAVRLGLHFQFLRNDFCPFIG